MHEEREEQPRVLHLLKHLFVGGTERQVVGFIQRATDPAKHPVAVMGRPGPLAIDLPGPAHQLLKDSKDMRLVLDDLRAAQMLRKLIKEIRPNIIHAHLGRAELVAALAAPRHLPIIVERGGQNVRFQKPPLKLIEGLAHRKVVLLLCNSLFSEREAREKDLWVPETRVIYNGIDVDHFSMVPLPSFQVPTIVQIANFHPYKGHSLVIEATGILRARHPSVRLILVGEGEGRSTVEAQVQRLALTESVEFTGQIDDVRGAIARAHVSVSGSLHEGFPNALIESLAMGRPVVAPPVGGIPELITHDRDGLLVERRPTALATALDRLLSDEEELGRFGARARDRALFFGWERMVKETEALYREVASRRHQSK